MEPPASSDDVLAKRIRLNEPGINLLHDPSFTPRYEILEKIGSGSFGSVYRARQCATGQHVAVKVLSPPRDTRSQLPRIDVLRLRRETDICAGLHHPNIVRLIDADITEEGPLFVVFELVPGCNLADLLATHGTLGRSDSLHLMVQVLDALSCAHASGVIHRDLKPANIMISNTGARRNAHVLDFGLATIRADTEGVAIRRLTALGEFLGTVAYCAPEQIHGQPPTPASDLYSWGLIFLECLTGMPAVDGRTFQEVIHRQLSPDPITIPSDLPEDLTGVLASVTQKDPARRPRSALEVLRALGTSRLPVEEAESRCAVSDVASSPRALPARSLGHIWSVPLGRNPSFTGREVELAQITDSLRASRLLAMVALRGLGGVGKTQLALEWAYRNASSYEVTAWLRAEHPDTLAADFADLAYELKLPECRTPDQNDRITGVRAWLQEHEDWLLIFDNATSPEAIRPYLPRTAAGHILVTSRNQSWRGLASTIPVEVLDPEDAIRFLLRRTGEQDESIASTVAHELGRLPLALEEAAAYMEATGRSMASYLTLFRQHHRALLAESNPPPDYPTTLLSTWDISFKRLDEEEPNATALLKLSAFLGPDEIPLKLLRASPSSLPAQLRDVFADEIGFDRAIAALRRYSLIKVNNQSISVHRLVQLVTRDRLHVQEYHEYAWLALQLVEAAFPRNAMEGDIHPDSAAMLPHARAALSHRGGNASSYVVAARLLERTATYLGARGLTREAGASMVECHRIIESIPGVNRADLAQNCSRYGMCLYALGEAPSALAQFRHALELRAEQFGPDDHRTILDLLNLAFALRNMGEFAEAAEHARRCLDLVERSRGESLDARIIAYGILARLDFAQNDVQATRRHVDAALEMLARRPTILRPLTSASLNHIAWVLLELGEISMTEQCIDKSFEVGSRAFGKDHPIVAVSHAVRGSLLQAQGQYDLAMEEFSRAVSGGERTCTRLHDDIAIARPRWARILAKRGELERARSLLTNSLTSLDRLCWDASQVEAEARVTLGGVLRLERRFAEAEAEVDRGLARLEERYGPDHPLLLPGLIEQGWLRAEVGDDDSARASFGRALATGEAAYGRDHLQVARSLEGLGSVELGAGRRDRGRELLSQALAIASNCRGYGEEEGAAMRARLERS